MTEAESWSLIADCTRQGDWTGVLVAADALQELGLEETAVRVRTLANVQFRPIDDGPNDRWVFYRPEGEKVHFRLIGRPYKSDMVYWLKWSCGVVPL